MKTLIAWPYYGSNPYLNMLYLWPRAHGWNIVQAVKTADLFAQLSTVGRGDVIHIHWTQLIAQSESTLSAAKEQAQRFTQEVSLAKSRGAQLVWTVHNEFPHDCPFPSVERELLTYLGENADLVIYINRHTLDVISDNVRIDPAKATRLGHASYVGVYPPPVPREDAKQQLNLDRASTCVGFVGQIKAYKGIDTLLHALAISSQTIPDLALLLAGNTDADQQQLVEELLPPGIPSARSHSFVPDQDIPLWYGAADVMAFPYTRILNSGSVHLAATFGRRVILPREHHLVSEFGEQSWVSFFEPGAHGAERLAELITQHAVPDPVAEQEARDFSHQYTPYAMTRDYQALLSALTSEASA
jgi:glycosyltransferase involved in cell wall biosynthesis